MLDYLIICLLFLSFFSDNKVTGVRAETNKKLCQPRRTNQQTHDRTRMQRLVRGNGGYFQMLPGPLIVLNYDALRGIGFSHRDAYPPALSAKQIGETLTSRGAMHSLNAAGAASQTARSHVAS